jgi:hypothetical protein
MGFPEIKTILADAITHWKTQHGVDPDLTLHGPTFPPLDKNYSKSDLLNAVAKGRPLIQPEVIGKKPPRGSEANLVMILKGPLAPPPAPAPQMPKGGPFIDPALVKQIEDWIDSGCPD